MADTFTGGYRTLIGAEPLNLSGTPVAPTKSLSSAQLTIKPKITAEAYTPEGGKAASSTTVTDDSTTLTIGGVAAFNELQIFLASAIVGDDGTNANVALAPTAQTPNTAQLWAFDSKLGSQDTRRSYTVERSSRQPAFGEQASGFAVAAFGMKSENPGKVTISGEMNGGQLRSTSDGITPAFTPVASDLATVGLPGNLSPRCANVYISTVSRADMTTNAATAKLLRVQSLGFDIKDRSAPFYEHNCNVQGAALNGEGMNTTVNFTVGANDRTQGYIKQLRNGDLLWIRYSWLGALIGVGPARYEFTIDFATFFNSYSEKKGLRGNLLGFDVGAILARDDNFYGAGQPGALSARLVNTAAAILG